MTVERPRFQISGFDPIWKIIHPVTGAYLL